MNYRNRSISYVLELLTLKRLAAGIIPDHIPAQLAVLWARAVQQGYSPFSRNDAHAAEKDEGDEKP